MTSTVLPELVLLHDDDEVQEQKNALLASIGLSEEELRQRGAAYLLTFEETLVLRELENLNFLLDT